MLAPTALQVAAIIALTVSCLLGFCRSFAHSVGAEILRATRDPNVQWILVICIVVYFLAFSFAELQCEGYAFRQYKYTILLTAFLVAAAFAYARQYAIASKTTFPLVLFMGLTLGKGAGFWWRWRRQNFKVAELALVFLLAADGLLLNAAAFPHGSRIEHQYHGVIRSSGLWDNPNSFGQLMGMSLVLMIGCFLNFARSSTPFTQGKGGSYYSFLQGMWPLMKVLTFCAIILTMWLLLRSFSRGSWFATVIALSYFALDCLTSRSTSFFRPFYCRSTAIVLLIGAALITSFWGCRYSENLIVRRAFSAANRNDFSWRNRVITYEGAIEMIAEEPWLGFGWNTSERVYGSYFRPAKLAEVDAFALNDFFILGATLGLPVLGLFVAYISLSFCGDGRWFRIDEDNGLRFGAICRAAAIALLVGFFFEGGLFRLATGGMFWILLELGRADI